VVFVGNPLTLGLAYIVSVKDDPELLGEVREESNRKGQMITVPMQEILGLVRDYYVSAYELQEALSYHDDQNDLRDVHSEHEECSPLCVSDMITENS